MQITVILAVLLILTSCTSKTECRLDPGVDVQVESKRQKKKKFTILKYLPKQTYPAISKYTTINTYTKREVYVGND